VGYYSERATSTTIYTSSLYNNFPLRIIISSSLNKAYIMFVLKAIKKDLKLSV
ncbi:hypothetical protein CCHL11_07064, partial [Colletotrichum chlorophyti]